MKKNILWIVTALAIGAPCVLYPTDSIAEESTTNKIKDEAGDIKTDVKKTARSGSQSVRKATGNDTMYKDAKDKVNDVGDDLSNQAAKAKRRNK